MNYYERHLGDYARDTGHLSMLEHGAYTLLMDRYYASEQGIPADQAYRFARARSQDERNAVDAVLREFFVLEDGVWTKGRIEAEIEKANRRISAARNNGGRGGRPKKTEKDQSEEKPNGFSLGSNLKTGSKALHTPDSIHQEKAKADTGSPGVDPPRPTAFADAKADRLRQVTQDAIDAYNAALGKPNGLLPAVHLLTPARLKQVNRCVPTMRAICQNAYGSTTITPQAWADYFAAVKDDPFRSGQQRGGRGHENWTPDFEYLTRPDVIAAVFDRAMSDGDDTEAAA